MKILRPGYNLDLFFDNLSKAKNRLLFLDYDGTLAPFQNEREKAKPYSGVREVLDAILEAGCCRMVLVSGRRIDDLLPLLGLKKTPEIWGSHGWERLNSDSTYEMADLDEGVARGFAEALDWAKREGLAGRCEAKPASVAFHWRGLTQERIEELRNKVLTGWSALMQAEGLVLKEFDGGIEMRALGRDKGYALRTVLEEGQARHRPMRQETVAAYLGDDLTDEDAFVALREDEALDRQKKLGILVRREWHPTAADVWLKPPEELLSFLSDWSFACINNKN